jgi:hypothetical protein
MCPCGQIPLDPKISHPSEMDRVVRNLRRLSLWADTYHGGGSFTAESP